MRKGKLIAVCVLALLIAGLTLFLTTRDSRPPVQVRGNLSATDVAQIERAVRRQLWREALPNFSKQSIRQFPQQAKRVLSLHVARIDDANWDNDAAGKRTVLASFSTNSPVTGYGYMLTNGPAGWSIERYYLYVVPD